MRSRILPPILATVLVSLFPVMAFADGPDGPSFDASADLVVDVQEVFVGNLIFKGQQGTVPIVLLPGVDTSFTGSVDVDTNIQNRHYSISYSFDVVSGILAPTTELTITDLTSSNTITLNEANVGIFQDIVIGQPFSGSFSRPMGAVLRADTQQPAGDLVLAVTARVVDP